MKVKNCPILFYGKEFVFNSLLGCLVSKDAKGAGKCTQHKLHTDNPLKKANIDAVNNPFKMERRKRSDNWKSVKGASFAKLYARLVTWLCLHCYPLSRLLFLFRINIFENAGDASMFYYSVYPNMKQQQTLCLPRALFIATTSRRFKQHGTMFIGAFLPTVRMHAWVVEDGMHADRFDNQWIYYQPVMMML